MAPFASPPSALRGARLRARAVTEAAGQPEQRVAQQAALNIHCRWPAVMVVGTYSPPLGFERDRHENERILARIAEAAPQVLVVGLGAPKQELWVHEHRAQIGAAAALCVGATIDFLAGRKRRAPRWLQRLGLEWCHRMLSEPRRLARRSRTSPNGPGLAAPDCARVSLSSCMQFARGRVLPYGQRAHLAGGRGY